jgi:5'/3'-nucleotidase SurE
MSHSIRVCALLAGLLLAPVSAPALDILLGNDDGQAAPGIQALRAALCAAGHHVTLVAPASDQSGRGGSINTGVASSSSAMALTRVASDACGVQYSLASPTVAGTYGGTPVDAIKAGLDIVLWEDPELIVSGLNQGQNLSQEGSNTSGTIGAALAGAFHGIPAIAGSVGVNFAESSTGFPSTSAAYAPASDFIVRLIDRLEHGPGPLLPKGVRVLNVNFPVPYGSIVGVALTQLGAASDLQLPLFDRNVGFPGLGLPGNPGVLNCGALSDGQACSVGVGVEFPPGPDPVKFADVDAHRANKISITPLDADMTSNALSGLALAFRIHGLQP